MSGIEDRDLAAAIGAEITYWRKRSGVDRMALGKAIRKSKNTVGRYERGNTMPTISETWRICDALGVSVSEFVSRVDSVVRSKGITVGRDAEGRMFATLPSGEKVVLVEMPPGNPTFPERETLTDAENAEKLRIRDRALGRNASVVDDSVRIAALDVDEDVDQEAGESPEGV